MDRAKVHRIGQAEMARGNFLFAAISAMARACVVIANSRSSFGRMIFALAEIHTSCRSTSGAPLLVDMDEELTKARLAAGDYFCASAFGVRS